MGEGRRRGICPEKYDTLGLDKGELRRRVVDHMIEACEVYFGRWRFHQVGGLILYFISCFILDWTELCTISRVTGPISQSCTPC
ncbi:hypothetical protein BDV29DRAFT_150934 [Aspergillus leporis]|uniref:Uncharacterized protein n=1 Tax=Aspergillus leporis TaxID=41062 RepID=A0A5N5WVD4_9EURO|nr:hypothetical protein BDV29DRAFT_150934 [Aspergillus leporis]